MLNIVRTMVYDVFNDLNSIMTFKTQPLLQIKDKETKNTNVQIISR